MNNTQTIPRQPTEQDYRDLAFLFAGEGSATVVREKRHKAKNAFVSQYIIHVGISITDRKIVDWLQRKFGKNISTSLPSNPKWSVAYHWRMYGDEGLELLKRMLPYLSQMSSKTRVIALLFKFREVQKQARGMKPGDHREKILNDLYWEIRKANAKGRKLPDPELDAVETERAAFVDPLTERSSSPNVSGDTENAELVTTRAV